MRRSRAVAHLRGKAGCDLATFGNHDLEHGIAGLRELLEGGYPFVSANLQVEDQDVQQHLRPAYIAEIGGWRIGIIGITALDPARTIAGITICNAGAYGANVGKVKLRRGSQGKVEVQTELIPQIETGPDDPLWLEARMHAAQAFQPLHETIIRLPTLPKPSDVALNRDREWALLARALSGQVWYPLRHYS